MYSKQFLLKIFLLSSVVSLGLAQSALAQCTACSDPELAALIGVTGEACSPDISSTSWFSSSHLTDAKEIAVCAGLNKSSSEIINTDCFKLLCSKVQRQLQACPDKARACKTCTKASPEGTCSYPQVADRCSLKEISDMRVPNGSGAQRNITVVMYRLCVYTCVPNVSGGNVPPSPSDPAL